MQIFLSVSFIQIYISIQPKGTMSPFSTSRPAKSPVAFLSATGLRISTTVRLALFAEKFVFCRDAEHVIYRQMKLLDAERFIIRHADTYIGQIAALDFAA